MDDSKIRFSYSGFPALFEGTFMRKNTKIMGILNVTPDSFYDGGTCQSLETAIDKAQILEQEGADILDIGGESSRPDANPVPVDEELERVIPLIAALSSKLKCPISIDTMKPKVAEAALEAGAAIINDVSGFCDPKMIDLAKESGASIIVVHMQGRPKSMQINPYYQRGVVVELLEWFQKKTKTLLKAGIRAENIILDPGIGFGKTVDDNLKILHNLEDFKTMGFQLLVGLSRKSFLSRILEKPAKETLAATLAMNALAMFASADIIRVHDVKEHCDVAKVIGRYFEANQLEDPKR